METNRKHKPGSHELRLMNGEAAIKTVDRFATRGAFWSFSDGQVIPSDLIGRLIDSGKLKPMNDGLFGDAQTYGWSE